MLIGALDFLNNFVDLTTTRDKIRVQERTVWYGDSGQDAVGRGTHRRGTGARGLLQPGARGGGTRTSEE